MLIKGVMCYKRINSWEKFNDVITTKRIFFQWTKQWRISDKDYRHAQNVWNKNKFNEKIVEEYQDIYNTTEFYLLSGVVQNFGKNIHKKYNFDSLNFATFPLLL